MFKKKDKEIKKDDAASVEPIVNETVNGEQQAENANAPEHSVFRTTMDDDETRKGVYIDKEEAERFLEQQRKKKKRKKIITTVVTVVVVLVAIFVVYKVIFGGNSGYPKWSSDFITKNDPKTVGKQVELSEGMQTFATVKNKMGGETVLKFSPKDSLLILEITNSKGDKEVIRSWPAPLDDEADPKTVGDEYPKYAKNHDIVSSLVRLGYTASNLDGGKDFGINQIDKVQISYFTIENGFKAKYLIPIDVTKTTSLAESYKVHYEFSFGVEFYLDENGELIVNVPKKDIVEDKTEDEYTRDSDEMPRVASIACLPFISATRQGDDGYFVTPDGSGGLTYFDVPRISQYDEYQKRIYGYDDIFDVFNYPNMTNETLSMPVYGVVRNGRLLTCYATESEANASILMGQPGMKSLKFYYITYVFKWREFYQAKLSQNGSTYTFLEVPSGIGDFTMRYSFEIDKDREYSYVDVAKNARDFIVDKWAEDKNNIAYLKDADINTRENKNQEPDLLNLKIFVADINQAYNTVIPRYKVMTTFAQAKDIISDTAAAMPRIRYSILGWQQSGYYGNNMRRFNLPSSTGGRAGLKELNSYAEENKATVSGDLNMLIIYGSPKGASLRQAAVKNPGTFYVNYKLVSTAGVFMKNTNYYYMSPLYYNSKMLNKDIKGISRLGFANVDLQQMGNLLYTDYNKENALLRQQALEYYRQWIIAYKKVFDTVSVYYGYEYAASVADNILDIPIESSRLFIIDESIPFIQLVYHGIIDYYSAPVNRSSDYTRTILKSVEYGALLSYEVTKEPTEELRYTTYNSLFKAQYDDLSSTIKTGYAIADKTLGLVTGAEIEAHRCVDGVRSGNVYCTTYNNGVKIYVNYGANEYKTSDGTVPALGIGVVANGTFETVKVG